LKQQNGNCESPTTNTTTYTVLLYLPTATMQDLDVVLGLAKRSKDVGGWNKDNVAIK
jgi:hypothetical protein